MRRPRLVICRVASAGIIRQAKTRRGLRIFCGYGVGIAGCLAGLLISVSADLPAGAVIVWSLAFFALIFSWTLWPVIRHKDEIESGS
ncbi:MAG: hypothetical protein DRR11_19035 [Gammaproteobacteria bacterium]|nr:MAG: hypothetical protein DRR11_19035 [Gammaproteobacteria bacterium]